MKKLFRIGLILFAFGLISGFGVYLYVFHKPHRNVAKEKPAFVTDAKTLYDDFINNEETSYDKYGDKVVEITGEVSDISIESSTANLVFLDPIEGINCSFDSITVANQNDKLSAINIGDKVTIKGKCDGYDMIMGVVLTRCLLMK
jgi:hypothetical protein